MSTEAGVTTPEPAVSIPMTERPKINAIWSQPQCEAIIAAELSLTQTESELESAAGETTEAKKAMNERWDGLHKAIGEVRLKFKGQQMDAEAQRAIFGLDEDYQRSMDDYELKDRQRRKLVDHAKKLEARLRKVLVDARSGEDLFTSKKRVEDKDAWKTVPLENLIGEMMVLPFREADIYTVGNFIESWNENKGNDVPAELFMYAAWKIVCFATDRGRAHDVTGNGWPVSSQPLPNKPVAEEPAEGEQAGDEPAEDDKAEDFSELNPPSEGEMPNGTAKAATKPQEESGPSAPQPLDEPANTRLDCLTPQQHENLRRTWLERPLPSYIAKRGKQVEGQFAQLISLEIKNPNDFLGYLSGVFTLRNAKKIREQMPSLSDWFVIWICDLIADKLTAYGNPEVWEALDQLIAYCEPAFDELTTGSRLAKVARWPENQRYGRALAPVEVGPDGKKVKKSKGKADAKKGGKPRKGR